MNIAKKKVREPGRDVSLRIQPNVERMARTVDEQRFLFARHAVGAEAVACRASAQRPKEREQRCAACAPWFWLKPATFVAFETNNDFSEPHVGQRQSSGRFCESDG